MHKQKKDQNKTLQNRKYREKSAIAMHILNIMQTDKMMINKTWK